MSTQQPALAVVATPIGNLEDLSLRAARVLSEADLIAAEDTRSAVVLLRAVDGMGVRARDGAVGKRRVISLFDGNEMQRIDEVLAAAAAGERVALISEAGTPLVSDPGARLVAAAIARNITITVIPGPNAAVAAVVASGLFTDRFLYLGFPPREQGARLELFGSLRREVATMVFYESPERVGRTFADLAAAFGTERQASLSREITKLFEEHVRGSVGELAAKFADTAPRGECTIVVQGASAMIEAPSERTIERQVQELLAQGLGPKDVAARLVVATGKPRRQLYQLALALARAGNRGSELLSDADGNE